MYFGEHPAFELPNNLNLKIWRYMDFTKLVSLLANEALFFTRADKFRDTFEGSFPVFNEKMGPIVYEDLNSEQLGNLKTQTRFFNNKLRERTIISCWYMSEYESAAMWDLYLKTNEGIAIQSNVKRLIDSFNEGFVTVTPRDMLGFCHSDRPKPPEICRRLLDY